MKKSFFLFSLLSLVLSLLVQYYTGTYIDSMAIWKRVGVPQKPPPSLYSLNGHHASVRTPDGRRNPRYSEGFYVVSLQGVRGADSRNNGRLDEFLRTWSVTCGRTQFTVCPGVVDDRRGFGLTKAYVHCLDQMYRDGVEIAYVFEDDSQLVNASFCARDVRKRLIQKAPKDLFVLLLGGHQWKARSVPTDAQFQPMSMSWGSYAWAIQRKHMLQLRNSFHYLLFEKRDMISPDVKWYEYATTLGKVIYRSDPLYFNHKAGWSNTWKRMRDKIDIDDWSIFDQIYVINLPHRLDKFHAVQQRFPGKANLTRWVASDGYRNIEDFRKAQEAWSFQSFDDILHYLSNSHLYRSPGAYGCLQTHTEVLKDAIAHNYSQILVLEDDVYFSKAPWYLPDRWDLVWLGALEYAPLTAKMKPPWYQPTTYTYGGHAYALKRSVYADLLRLREQQHWPNDRTLAMVAPYYRSFVLYPNVVIPDIRTSTTSHHTAKRRLLSAPVQIHKFGWNVSNYRHYPKVRKPTLYERAKALITSIPRSLLHLMYLCAQALTFHRSEPPNR